MLRGQDKSGAPPPSPRPSFLGNFYRNSLRPSEALRFCELRKPRFCELRVRAPLGLRTSQTPLLRTSRLRLSHRANFAYSCFANFAFATFAACELRSHPVCELRVRDLRRLGGVANLAGVRLSRLANLAGEARDPPGARAQARGKPTTEGAHLTAPPRSPGARFPAAWWEESGMRAWRAPGAVSARTAGRRCQARMTPDRTHNPVLWCSEERACSTTERRIMRPCGGAGHPGPGRGGMVAARAAGSPDASHAAGRFRRPATRPREERPRERQRIATERGTSEGALSGLHPPAEGRAASREPRFAGSRRPWRALASSGRREPVRDRARNERGSVFRQFSAFFAGFSAFFANSADSPGTLVDAERIERPSNGPHFRSKCPFLPENGRFALSDTPSPHPPDR
jgi:hypothetical protein